ncbi:uncharacterized protein LOC111613374 [Centruroides sculpturatus]|uniref:uncharacterized protein LOC111613374 n=1 Tax=Centruroides sculpturatus TaxID=218467 RepID=UPI000C6CA037|nr:uncharacterized protein LOC111613374 [Centruroides sculpturatus]
MGSVITETFHLNANNILDELKEYALNNPKGQFETAKHAQFIYNQFHKIISLAENTIIDAISNIELPELLENRLKLLADKEDIKNLINSNTMFDSQQQILENLDRINNNMFNLDSAANTINNQMAVMEKIRNIEDKTNCISLNDSNMEVQKAVLEKLDRIENKTTQNIPSQPTYSSVLNNGKDGQHLTNKSSPQKEVILIYNKDKDNNNSDVVRKLMQIRIKPSQMHIGIDKMRKIRGGIAVEIGQKRDAAIFEKTIEEQIPELVTRRPKRRWPHVIIYSIHGKIPKEELPGLIYQQNPYIYENFMEKEFMDNFRTKFNTSKRHATYKNWIFQVSPNLRQHIIKLGKVSIEWSRCRVGDFCPILQCFKCCGYNHSARDCPNAHYTCSHCSGDHTYNECPNYEQEPLCCNCEHEGVHNVIHNARDSQCPIYQRIKTYIESRTEYGSGQ